jgi:sterol desaturase/sphingolipid hydroxylase (fatty acid hydroxylase superfamily)
MFDQTSDLLQRLQAGLSAPVRLFLVNADVRYFWAYLAAVPLILLIMKARGGPEAATIGRVFHKDTWLADSALVDVWLFVLTSILQFTLLAGLFLNAAMVADLTANLLKSAGAPHLLSEHGLGAMIALTITAFLAADFGKFIAHYWAHRVPALWEFHKVHHAAEVLNPFTAERFHPVELIFDSLVIGVLTGAANGVFIALAGPGLSPVQIAGANILWVIANLAGGPIRHLPAWCSYGPKIEGWILSPAQHQIHHSEEERHFDKNLGATLAIWDRLFGTLYVTHGVENIRYGIGPETAQFRTVAENYWRPLAALWRLGFANGAKSQPAAS